MAAPLQFVPKLSHVQDRVVVTLLFVALTVAMAACSLSDSTSSHPQNQPVISEIVDGDTIEVMFPTGISERVRLLGIDTPETSDPTRPVQCFGAEATARLGELIPPGTVIRLERDIEARDQYGRLLAYVFRGSDDLFVNEALLREGFADISIYEPNSAYRNALTHAATRAKTGEMGLWLQCGGADVALDPATPTNVAGFSLAD